MEQFLSEIWGIEKLFIKNNFTLSTDSANGAIILCACAKNFDRFIALESFRQILQNLGCEGNLFGAQKAQIGVINGICTLKISRFETLENLEILCDEKIIEKSHLEQISTFLHSLKLANDEIRNPKTMQNGFYKNISILNEIADVLAKFDSEIAHSKQVANENIFTISVTGVINAGKSSMLNALLGDKILGTSNIPETANLTLLKYAKTPSANVIFYNEKEKKEMNLGEYPIKNSSQIQPNTTNISISPNELLRYTSAKFEISRYIKMIELSINSEFLGDNIEIVDTPGLDDSITQRELLTKHFMAKSDAIIHLMNAAQSATNKDTSFICETLATSKNSRLIVVLTHADMLSESELISALRYTKNAIKDDLMGYKFDADLVNNVKFFCIDSVSGRGICELKNFIYDEFFGENSARAQLILQNYKKDLRLSADKLIEQMNFELSNLSQSDAKILENSEKLQAQINQISQEISQSQTKLSTDLSRLDYTKLNFMPTAQISLIKDRVIADLKYAKTKKIKPDFTRINVILISGLRDSVIEIFRDFSQRISRDIENIRASLGANFDTVAHFKFDTKSYFDKEFGELKFDEISNEICNLIRANDNLENLGTKILASFDMFFQKLDLKTNLNSLAKICAKEFENGIKDIFLKQKNKLFLKQKSLVEILANSNKDSKNSQEKIINLKQNLALILEQKQKVTQ